MGPDEQATQSLTPDEGARKWMFKKAHKEFWRIASWYDFDDLIQDGLMLYTMVRRRYPDATNPEHIMSLFARTYSNHITDLAQKCSRDPGSSKQCGYLTKPRNPALEEDFELESIPCGLAEILELIAEAPDVVKASIRALIADISAFAPLEKRSNRTRETNNERLAKLIGLDLNEARRLNPYQMVYNYLKEQIA